MAIRPRAEWYWFASINNYDKSTANLSVRIEDYNPVDITAFFTQAPRAAVETLEFSGIRWSDLSEHLSSYRRAAFEHLLIKEHEEAGTPQIIQRSSEWNYSKENQTLERAFSVPFVKAKFITGGVLVTRQIEGHEVQLMIENGFILKEFDLLKEYFAKVLGQKQFTVKARITIEKGKLNEVKATSTEISKIDERILDSVKYLEAKSIRNIAPPDVDRELFTAADLYGREPDAESIESGMALLELLLRDPQIRNRNQIQYLAGKLHTPQKKIRFTTHPQFGFVFTVHGKELTHFVWELLNSHATYLWSFEQATISEALARKKLDYALSAVRKQGRQAYRIEMTEDMGVSDLIFQVIIHDHISSGIVDSFPLWRARLHEKLM